MPSSRQSPSVATSPVGAVTIKKKGGRVRKSSDPLPESAKTPSPHSPQRNTASSPINKTERARKGNTQSCSAVVIRGRQGSTTGKTFNQDAERAAEEFLIQTIKKGVDGISDEFDALQEAEIPLEKLQISGFKENMERNRYKDVPCLDATRPTLRLNVPPETSYIHANRVDMSDVEIVFLATQAPMVETIPDFWRLCYQESVVTILMLCGLNEAGGRRCVTYWPTKNLTSETYGCMTITSLKIDINVASASVVHSLEMKCILTDNGKPYKPKPVTLIRFNEWPDRGVPKTGRNLINILRSLEKTGPCLIHCSAGIGRTGAAIAIETAIQKIIKGKVPQVRTTVEELRCKRAYSVQSDVQYFFIFYTVLEYIKYKLPKLGDRLLPIRRALRSEIMGD